MNTLKSSDLPMDFRIFEATPGISVIVRPDTPTYTLIAISNDFIDFTKLKREDIIGKTYSHFFLMNPNGPHLTGEHNLKASFDYTIANKVTHEIPVQRLEISNREGKFATKFWKVKNVPLFDEAGQVTLIIHSLFDITDSVVGDDHLESVGIQKAHKFFMNAPVIIGYLRGDDYLIEFANDGLLKVWDKTKEVIGKPLFNVFPELEQQGTKHLLDEVRKTGKPFFAYEHPLHFQREGRIETLYFDFVYQPYYENDHQQMASGIISVGHDVTEQIRARQMQRSLEELRYANQNLEEFAYAASHDLKEPVRKILYFANRLREELKDKLDQPQIDLFQRMEKSLDRMQNLIDDLLEYSHAAKGSAEQEEIDLNMKVKNVLEDLELEIQKRQAKIISYPLPTIIGNKRQIQQLFQNLISNALKYSKPGVVPEILITSHIVNAKDIAGRTQFELGDKMFHLLEISDNGIGFDQKDAEKIFKVFARLHSATQYKGTGLGLSIVRKVVESHSGYIWAESTPGKGASFKILLPFK